MKKYIIAENDIQSYGNGVSNLYNYTDRQEAVSMLHCLMKHAAVKYGAPEQEEDEFGYINGMYYVDLFEIEDDSIARDDLAEVVSWLESNFTKDGLQDKQDGELREIIKVLYDKLNDLLGESTDDRMKKSILEKMEYCRSENNTFSAREIEWFKNNR